MLHFAPAAAAAAVLVAFGVSSASAAVAPHEGGGLYRGQATFAKPVTFGLNVSEDGLSVEPLLGMYATKAQCKGAGSQTWFRGLAAGKDLPVMNGRFSGAGVSGTYRRNGYQARWTINGEFVTPNIARGELVVTATFRTAGRTVKCEKVTATFNVRG